MRIGHNSPFVSNFHCSAKSQSGYIICSCYLVVGEVTVIYITNSITPHIEGQCSSITVVLSICLVIGETAIKCISIAVEIDCTTSTNYSMCLVFCEVTTCHISIIIKIDRTTMNIVPINHVLVEITICQISCSFEIDCSTVTRCGTGCKSATGYCSCSIEIDCTTIIRCDIICEVTVFHSSVAIEIYRFPIGTRISIDKIDIFQSDVVCLNIKYPGFTISAYLITLTVDYKVINIDFDPIVQIRV